MKNRVEEFRNLNNEKQEDLANVVGVSRQTIISIEKGKYNPSIILAFKIAKHYGVPFYVFCPSSTVDKNCKTGDDIVIEERKPSEIFEMFYKNPVARENTKCYNPAFDVTDNSLITAIITEKGICRAPYDKSLAEKFLNCEG